MLWVLLYSGTLGDVSLKEFNLCKHLSDRAESRAVRWQVTDECSTCINQLLHSTTWWIEALSRTTTDLGLRPLNGYNIGTIHLSTKGANFSPLAVLTHVNVFDSSVDTAATAERRSPQIDMAMSVGLSPQVTPKTMR